MKFFRIKITACSMSIVVLFSSTAASGYASGKTCLGGRTITLTSVPTYVIAEYEASARQRRIAEADARRAAELRAESIATERQKERVRYLAISTSRTKQSRGAASYMLYDTKKKQLVNDQVYDCKKKPADNEVVKFDGYQAECVGT